MAIPVVPIYSFLLMAVCCDFAWHKYCVLHSFLSIT